MCRPLRARTVQSGVVGVGVVSVCIGVVFGGVTAVVTAVLLVTTMVVLAVVGAAVGAAFAGVVGYALSRPRSRVGGLMMSQAGRLPLQAVRAGYLEEWQGWLYDLREQGEPWYRRLIEVLSIVFVAAPWLAVTSRLGRRKVVD